MATETQKDDTLTLSVLTLKLEVFSPSTKLIASIRLDFPARFTKNVRYLPDTRLHMQRTCSIRTYNGCKPTEWPYHLNSFVRFEIFQLQSLEKPHLFQSQAPFSCIRDLSVLDSNRV